MKRADYALLAKFVKGLRGYVKGTTKTKTDPFGETIREEVFVNLVSVLKVDNANFNSEAFRKDCGL